MTYHPETNPKELPAINCVADLDKLPWGGNHWWDYPIMLHVEKFVTDESKPRALRKQMLERAGYLMTGEDCSLTEAGFDEQLSYCLNR